MQIPFLYRVAQKAEQSIFSGLCSDQQLAFFQPCWIEHLFFITITPRSSNLVENFFILWVISYGLSFSRFARFPETRGTINEKWMANSENDSPHSKNTRVSVTRKRVHWGQTQFYLARVKKITVDQSKVLKIRQFRFFLLGPPGNIYHVSHTLFTIYVALYANTVPIWGGGHTRY